MFGKVESVADNNRSWVDVSKYPIFELHDKVGVEKEIDVVKSFEVCVVKIFLDESDVFETIESVEKSSEANSETIDVIANTFTELE